MEDESGLLDPRLRGPGAKNPAGGELSQDAGSEHGDESSPSSFGDPSPAHGSAPGEDTSPHAAGAGALDPNDPKRPRACEACRGLKVKCEPDPANPDGPCKRCSKAGRQCVVTQPTRKRQKKTDSRVAELEKKIDALTASLHASRGSGPGHQAGPGEDNHGFGIGPYGGSAGGGREWGSGSTPSEPARPTFNPPIVMAGQKRKFTETRESPVAKELPIPTPTMSAPKEYSDVIDRGLLTMEQATRFFARYNDLMVQHLPVVVFEPGTPVAEIRKTKPILFLAVVAASSSEEPTVQRPLVKELMQLFAEKIIVIGEKSFELIQALIVAVIWYFPPDHFEELKFYQFVHIASVMAIDVGLGKKKANTKTRLIPYTWRDHPMRRTALPDPTTIEARRIWLGCYFLTSNVAMALHRPNLVRWSNFMTESMEILESSPEAAPTDQYLCHLVWTHRLAEEVGHQFSMDDPSTFINVSEPKVQYALRGFENDLAKYTSGIKPEHKQPALILSLHVISLYMHEIALYVDKGEELAFGKTGPDHLKEPVPGLSDSLTTAHISALSSCLTAIDGIFDTYLTMSVESIRSLPIFNFVRIAYAVVVLIKMYFSASTPNSELGKVINKDNMKVDEYMDKLLEKFRAVSADDRSRPAGKFLVVLVMLRSWFLKQGTGAASGAEAAAVKNEPQSAQANTPNSRSAETPASTSAMQQQGDYNPNPTANTPLQLLSEVATGNSGSRNATPGNPNSGTPGRYAGSPWVPPGSAPPGPNPFIYNRVNEPTPNSATHMPMPWLNNAFGADFDYTNSIPDGLEQAMDMTLYGFSTPNPNQFGMGDAGGGVGGTPGPGPGGQGGSPQDGNGGMGYLRSLMMDPTIGAFMESMPNGPGSMFPFS